MNYIINNMYNNVIEKGYTRTTFLNELFSSTRFKSFLWRAGAIGLVAIVGYAQQEITNLQLNETTIVFLGLILGEITKALNNVIQSQ